MPTEVQAVTEPSGKGEKGHVCSSKGKQLERPEGYSELLKMPQKHHIQSFKDLALGTNPLQGVEDALIHH